jgi:hypothetical protein
MSETDHWLDDYGASHRNIRYPALYWPAVPALVVATVGLLWSLPVPDEFARISPALNWGSTFLMAALIYYFIISMPLAIGMLPFVFGVAAVQVWLGTTELGTAAVAATLFPLCIAGLYLGHYPAGGNRAVFRDIQLMMIAPAWLLSLVYRRFGIPY